jgi:hypothetical protein
MLGTGPAAIRCLHWGLPIKWWRGMRCNFQHPPGSGRLRPFIASRIVPPPQGFASLPGWFRASGVPPEEWDDGANIEDPGGVRPSISFLKVPEDS